MDFCSRILLSTAGLAATTLSLSACAGAPAPCTEPESSQKMEVEAAPGDQPAESGIPEISSSSSIQIQSSSSEITDKVNSSGNDSPKTINPIESAPAKSVPDTGHPQTETSVDPYTAFPAMAASVFTYADSLYKQGNVDGAIAYLQRFRIIKPLWNQWENQADSLLEEYGKTNAEQLKQYEPLVLEIQNMNRARAAYSLVAQAADSLIALAPGDSLQKFATQQKQIAYENTLNKASREKDEILKLATDQAKFTEAEQKAIEFQMRYRDFEESLKIQSLIEEIRGMAAASDSEAAAYWQKNDPAEALTKARDLSAKAKFQEAREILTKLKASTLRKEALEEYDKLADAFCNTQRKLTSQLFGKAQKQKDGNKKKNLLQQAIDSLEKCLAEYPENSQKQKVLDNKNFLQKELEK